MSTRYGYGYASEDEFGSLWINRALITSLVVHIALLALDISLPTPVMEERKDAIQVTIALPEKPMPVEKVKPQVVKNVVRAEKSEPVKIPKPIAGTKKVVKDAKVLGNPNAKIVQKVQKGDPRSSDLSKYKPGTDFRRLKQTNIGSGAAGMKMETAKTGGGSGDTYKGLDFATKSLSNFAPVGARLKIKGAADDGGAGSGKGGGIGDGLGKSFGDGTVTGTSSGTLEKAKILTNAGSLTGSTVGAIGTSKGAEGLARKGQVVIAGIPDETVVLGSLDPNVIRQILLDNLSRFRYCYQSELDGNDRPKEISGVISLNFNIGPQGRVQNTRVAGQNSLPGQVRSCVAGVLAGIQFPEPRGGGLVEVKQPMNFYPKTI